MIEQLKFSPAERELLVELLQREHDDLPVEIHHCRVAAYREDLRRRQAMVQDLLDRMQVVVEV
jgi:hypothetical protein